MLSKGAREAKRMRNNEGVSAHERKDCVCVCVCVCVCAVSYTHLDVYKRQVFCACVFMYKHFNHFDDPYVLGE